LDRALCPDTEIQVLPNLGIAVDRVSCPDTDIGVLTTRFPRASYFEKPTRSVPETTTNTCKPRLAGFNHLLCQNRLNDEQFGIFVDMLDTSTQKSVFLHAGGGTGKTFVTCKIFEECWMFGSAT
jgi:hypothetical protein